MCICKYPASDLWSYPNKCNKPCIQSLFNSSLNLFQVNKTNIEEDRVEITDLKDSALEDYVGKEDADQLREDIELIEGVYEPFNKEEYLKGNLAPVFFGSALNNFGVQELLDSFIGIAPSPKPTHTDVREIIPTENKLSGFVFKIHANLDPKHRDRIAFFKICSGVFERNKFYHHVRNEKKVRFSNPTSFMAQDKSVIDQAFPGDVIGLYDTGSFKIGDTLTEGEDMTFKGIPSFSPEIFRELINKDPMKSKQLEKGISQLTDEGVAQMFIQQPGNRKIIGVVGELQFEVIQYRLQHEYGASCDFQHRNFHKACWMTSDDKDKIEEFVRRKSSYIAYDKDENPVFLAESAFLLRQAEMDYPEIKFHTTSEFKV